MPNLDLATLEARACTGKHPLGENAARQTATRIRTQTGQHVSPYGCPFCHRWHVGHDMSPDSLANLARLLRARSGNAPTPPGTGGTRRSRRKAERREVAARLPQRPLAGPAGLPVGSDPETGGRPHSAPS